MPDAVLKVVAKKGIPKTAEKILTQLVFANIVARNLFLFRGMGLDSAA